MSDGVAEIISELDKMFDISDDAESLQQVFTLRKEVNTMANNAKKDMRDIIRRTCTLSPPLPLFPLPLCFCNSPFLLARQNFRKLL